MTTPTNHVPLVAAIRAGSRDNNNILFFSKSGLVFAKIDKIECGFLEIVQRWLPLGMYAHATCADFFYIKFLLQIPLENDILYIFNGRGFCMVRKETEFIGSPVFSNDVIL